MKSYYVTFRATIETTVRVPADNEEDAVHFAERKFVRLLRAIRQRHASLDDIREPEVARISPHPPGFQPGDLL